MQKQSQPSSKRLAETLTNFIPLVRQVIQQATCRVLQGEQVPASEKTVSIFDEHTDIILRGKESRQVKYEHKAWFVKGCSGMRVLKIVSAFHLF